MTATQPVQEKFAVTTSRGFESWLARMGGSLAVSTYQAGKFFLFGQRPDGRLSVFERTFPRCMGIGVSPDGRALLLATHYQLFRFDNVIPQGGNSGGYDALYVPRVSWITGDLDIHDVAFDKNGRPVFVNTLFNCIAAASEGYSFRPLWRPSFISKLAPEDRCHLNGMALDKGSARYATAVSRSDVSDGWRDKRRDGGIVIDVAGNKIVAQGLSMPHSPRLDNGRIWLLNSGTGEFGLVDLKSGRFESVAFCPGYARGLAIAKGYAVIGLSLARENRTFQGLVLDEQLSKHGAEPRCGLLAVDLTTGNTVAWLRIEGVVRELYDVAFLPGIRRPSALGFMTDEIQRTISIDDG
jgi:uncharacterized protein (TIGR03032 family)